MRRIEVPDATVVRTVDEVAGVNSPDECDGALVRLRPSKGATQVEVDAAEVALRKHALAVRVLPLVPSDRLVLQDDEEGNTGVTGLPSDPRKFVLELATTSNSRDTEALTEYLGELADKEGQHNDSKAEPDRQQIGWGIYPSLQNFALSNLPARTPGHTHANPYRRLSKYNTRCTVIGQNRSQFALFTSL